MFLYKYDEDTIVFIYLKMPVVVENWLQLCRHFSVAMLLQYMEKYFKSNKGNRKSFHLLLHSLTEWKKNI